DGFSAAARSGLEVGAGQTGASIQMPPGVPAAVVVQLQHLAHDVFTHAFVVAMRPTLLVPIVIIVIAAIACFGVRNRPAMVQAAKELQAEVSSAAGHLSPTELGEYPAKPGGAPARARSGRPSRSRLQVA